MRRLGRTLRAVNALLTLAVVLFVVIGGLAVLYDSQIDAAGPLTTEAPFVVRRGEGAREIGKRLEDAKIIASQHLFVANYLVHSFGRSLGGKGLNLQAGEYMFEPGVSVRYVANIIGEGKTSLLAITIPEGLTSHQIVERLMRIQTLTGEVTEVPAEGTLMPDTYRVSRTMDRNKVLAIMQREMQSFMSATWERRREGIPVKTPQDAVILASIVEKETGKRDERARVAGVFVNRMTKGMRLQSDPTILYGVDGGRVKWGRPIYRSEINAKSSHNTYQIDGLPPTPICNPGRASIEAVLNPARTTDIYFVADGTGGHVFSETLQEHNAAVAQWRRIERELIAKRNATGGQQEGQKPGSERAGGEPLPDLPQVVNAPEAIKASAAGGSLGVPVPARKPRRAKALP